MGLPLLWSLRLKNIVAKVGSNLALPLVSLMLGFTGIGSTLTIQLVNEALRSVDQGGLGKEHVAIFWVEGGPADRLYRKLGFVEGYQRLDCRLAGSD